jgi:site-specific DNA-methyltransferase (adenine-specific)
MTTTTKVISVKSRHILVISDNLNMSKHIKENVLPTRKFDCCVTSPPYKNSGENDVGYSAFHMHNLTRNLRERLHGPLWLNFGDLAGQMERAPMTANTFNPDFSWIQTIIWVKSLEGKGQFTPIGGEKRFNSTHEYIYLMVPQSWTNKYRLDRLAIGVPYTDKANIKRFKHDVDLRCPGTVWFIPYETVQKGEEKGHPHRFPVELPRRCLMATKMSSDPWVLDPFAGSGTTMVAAKELGINSVGYEMDESMISVIQERIPDVEIIS